MATNGIQKNFTLPPYLVEAWEKLQTPRSKESSVNGAGALLLFLSMPDTVRYQARKIAARAINIETAKKEFWNAIKSEDDERYRAKNLLGRTAAREAKPRKKKHDRPSKAG